MDVQQLTKEFEVNRPKLRAFIFRLVADRSEADDIVQDTYVKAATKLDTFKGASSLKTWIFSIAANLSKDHLRTKKRWPDNAMDLAKEETLKFPDRYLSQFQKINASPSGGFELREHINFCFTCICKTLSIDHQVVILLKEFFDFKVSEIAEITGKTEGTVKHALMDSRGILGDIFEHRCALINKAGVCHQCSELNGLFNPEQNFQEEKIKTELHNDMSDKTKDELFNLRTRIAKTVDPYECNGRDLHFFHFDHIANVLKSS
jgi:RNA polymerase sigma-70 factor (ECF subfamily)